MRFVFLFLCIVIFLFSCTTSKKTEKQHVLLDTLSVSANNNPMNIYRATTIRTWDITHTLVKLSFNMQQKIAYGRVWIDAHPYNKSMDSIELDAKSMRIDSVGCINENGYFSLPFTYNEDKLVIHGYKRYSNKDTIHLFIQYVAMPYAAPINGSNAIVEDRGLYFINSKNIIPKKPVQIWTQGETESNSHWLPTIDKPNERFTFQIELTVPDSFKTLSNGYLLSSIKNGNGERIDSWVMDKPIQPYALMFAIGKYDIVKEYWHGKEISYYSEPDYTPYVKLMFQHTTKMLDYFSEITGVPYPWNKYSQVVVRDYVSGAMENTSASLFGEFMNQDNREVADDNYEDVVAHELFHQWFGDYVTAESWSNITLSESFADYSEYLWRKYQYGNEYADELLLSSLTSYLIQSQRNDPALVRYYYADREDVFDRISYQKGGQILHYLHTLIGDSAFRKAMSIYLSKNAYQNTEAAQWRQAIEEATGEDWNWFFNEWYYKGGHPVIDISYSADEKKGMLKVNIKQLQTDNALYTLPLKTAIVYGDDVTIVDWNIKQKNETYFYPYKYGKKPVVIADIYHSIPGEMIDHKSIGDWYTTYHQSNNYIDKVHALYAAIKIPDNTIAITIINDGLNDQYYSFRVKTLQLLQQMQLIKWQNRWKSQVAYMAANDGNNKVRSAAFNVLASWKIASSKHDMLAAIFDSSYSVAGAALSALYTIDKDTAYSICHDLIETEPEGNLQLIIWTILGDIAQSKDTGYFIQKQYEVSIGEKELFMANTMAFLKNNKDTNAFKCILSVATDAIKREEMKSVRLKMGKMLILMQLFYYEQAKRGDSMVLYKRELIKKSVENIVAEEKDVYNLTKYKQYLENNTDN